MRRDRWLILLMGVVLFGVAGPAARAQDRKERRIARLMDELREEMWEFRRGLNYFSRAPEYNRLVDLRWDLRNSATRVAELEGKGPRAEREQREKAVLMDRQANELKRLTTRLENRTDVGAAREVKRRADQLKAHADRIELLIDRLKQAVR
jgi:hypothetical protein